jgi:hypothetical protein
MESPFPAISPSVFIDKSLWVRKAREDIEEVDAMPSHIALPLDFSPFIHRVLQYPQLYALVKACDEPARHCP